MAVPQNEIVRSTTRKYLADLDLKNPPSPSEIEDELLTKVNNQFTAENVGRAPGSKFALLKKLTCTQVAEIMLRLHRVVRIAPAGKNTDRDFDLLAIYVSEGEQEGIYETGDSEINLRVIARCCFTSNFSLPYHNLCPRKEQ